MFYTEEHSKPLFTKTKMTTEAIALLETKSYVLTTLWIVHFVAESKQSSSTTRGISEGHCKPKTQS